MGEGEEGGHEQRPMPIWQFMTMTSLTGSDSMNILTRASMSLSSRAFSGVMGTLTYVTEYPSFLNTT